MLIRTFLLSLTAGLFIGISGTACLSCGRRTAFLALVVLGNTLGGLFLPALRLLAKKRP